MFMNLSGVDPLDIKQKNLLAFTGDRTAGCYSENFLRTTLHTQLHIRKMFTELVRCKPSDEDRVFCGEANHGSSSTCNRKSKGLSEAKRGLIYSTIKNSFCNIG